MIRNGATVIGSILILFFVVKTFSRNPDFVSNQVLLTQDIKESSKSAKMQHAYGSMIAGEAMKTQDTAQKKALAITAKEHLDTAIMINPTFLQAFYMRGNVDFMQNDIEAAVSDYEQCLSLNPDFNTAYGNYALALRESAKYKLEHNGDIAKAIEQLEKSLQYFPEEEATRTLLQAAQSRLASPQ